MEEIINLVDKVTIRARCFYLAFLGRMVLSHLEDQCEVYGVAENAIDAIFDWLRDPEAYDAEYIYQWSGNYGVEEEIESSNLDDEPKMHLLDIRINILITIRFVTFYARFRNETIPFSHSWEEDKEILNEFADSIIIRALRLSGFNKLFALKIAQHLYENYKVEAPEEFGEVGVDLTEIYYLENRF
ncbi:Hypothetical protein PBC10988_18940 [Planctomycetales bacterium 10988]|nr:Hypothetical protein PBC10988_18940 [Planctomycetales bacterium 10988]